MLSQRGLILDIEIQMLLFVRLLQQPHKLSSKIIFM